MRDRTAELDDEQRALLSTLAARGGECGLVRVARDVAAGNGDASPARTRRVYSRLRTRMDELVAAGLVEYRETEGVVRLAD
jgi:hypothetical protein